MQWTVGHSDVQRLEQFEQCRQALQLDEPNDETVRRGAQGRLEGIEQGRVRFDFGAVLVRGRFVRRGSLELDGHVLQSFDVVLGGGRQVDTGKWSPTRIGGVQWALAGAVDLPFLLRWQTEHRCLVWCGEIEFLDEFGKLAVQLVDGRHRLGGGERLQGEYSLHHADFGWFVILWEDRMRKKAKLLSGSIYLEIKLLQTADAGLNSQRVCKTFAWFFTRNLEV